MSAQFIHSNNQSMLWKVINNTPQTISYFANAPFGEKERWFQSIIGHVYNQYNGKNISLKDMNKRAIDFMLQSLVPSINEVPIRSDAPIVQLQSVPLRSLSETREQQMHEQFSRRQAEYESMVKKETPVPQFTGGVKDEAILDLDYAVKEYMKQRDQDIDIPKPESISRGQTESLSQLAPLAPPIRSVASNDAPIRSVASNDAPKRLNLQNAEPISLTVEELPTKKVQWGENTEHVFDKNESISRGNEVPRETHSLCESIILENLQNAVGTFGTSVSLLQKDISEIKTKLDLIIDLLRKKE